MIYTMEQHDSHYMDDDAQEDCADCQWDARIDKIERRIILEDIYE